MSDRFRLRRTHVAALVLFALAALAAVLLAALRGGEERERVAGCPPGYHRFEPRAQSSEAAEAEGAEGEAQQRPCVLRQPETPEELLTVAHGIAARAGLDAPGTLAAA